MASFHMLNCKGSCLHRPWVHVLLKTGQFGRRESWVSEATNLHANAGAVCICHVPHSRTAVGAEVKGTTTSEANAIAICKLVCFILREFPHGGYSFNRHLLFGEACLNCKNISRLLLAQIAMAQTDALRVGTCDCHLKLATVALGNSDSLVGIGRPTRTR